jgi:hypothetical protein
MCDHCDNPLTRRGFLAAAGAASIAALAACSDPVPVRDNLPDPPDMFNFADLPPGGPPLHIDPKTVPIPPVTPPQRTDFGEIFPRSAWTASSAILKNGIRFESDDRNSSKHNPRDLVVIHHSGDGKPFRPATRTDVIRHLEIVRRAHLQRGMIDIAYHFAVDPMGHVWQLRSLVYEGQHCRPAQNGQSWNSHSIGLCALGDFNLQPLPAAQRDRLLTLVRLIRDKYALAPAAVRLHGELVDTDCPGKSLRAAVVQARKQNTL